jgi:hypothetical protein
MVENALVATLFLKHPIGKKRKVAMQSLQAMGMVLMFPCGQYLTGKLVGITNLLGGKSNLKSLHSPDSTALYQEKNGASTDVYPEKQAICQIKAGENVRSILTCWLRSADGGFVLYQSQMPPISLSSSLSTMRIRR